MALPGDPCHEVAAHQVARAEVKPPKVVVIQVGRTHPCIQLECPQCLTLIDVADAGTNPLLQEQLPKRGCVRAAGASDYRVQIDFANASNDNSGLQPPSFGNLTSSPAPHNIWMQMRDVPYLGNVRIGNQDKPVDTGARSRSSACASAA